MVTVWSSIEDQCIGYLYSIRTDVLTEAIYLEGQERKGWFGRWMSLNFNPLFHDEGNNKSGDRPPPSR